MTVTVIDMMVVCATKTDIKVDQSILKKHYGFRGSNATVHKTSLCSSAKRLDLYLCIKAFSLNTQ